MSFFLGGGGFRFYSFCLFRFDIFNDIGVYVCVKREKGIILYVNINLK